MPKLKKKREGPAPQFECKGGLESEGKGWFTGLGKNNEPWGRRVKRLKGGATWRSPHFQR